MCTHHPTRTLHYLPDDGPRDEAEGEEGEREGYAGHGVDRGDHRPQRLKGPARVHEGERDLGELGDLCESEARRRAEEEGGVRRRTSGESGMGERTEQLSERGRDKPWSTH